MKTLALHSLTLTVGAKHKKKLLGRGPSSGHGGSSTRGQRGQRARSGEGKRLGFEGGQMPLIRRLPKRGFNPPRKNVFQIVNLERLSNFKEGSKITPALLKEYGLIKKEHEKIKILARGKLKHSLTIQAHAFSKKAEEKIKEVGGKIEKI